MISKVLIIIIIPILGIFYLWAHFLQPSYPSPSPVQFTIVNPSPTLKPIPTATLKDQPTPSVSPTVLITPEVKVVSVAYFPIKDGRLDQSIVNNSWSEYNMTLDEVRSKIDRLNKGLSESLTVGTAYKKYRLPSSPPYLHYTFVDKIERQEAAPASTKNHPYSPGLKITDYSKILSNINVCDYVDVKSVGEIWLWSYTGQARAGFESNFSSPYGDIGNSDRDPNDLPRCKHSYTVYEYNYGRDIPEAMEDHIHQYEALFNFLNRDLFWNHYVGYFPGGSWNTSQTIERTRRCGWAHYPPNGEKDYDWQNKTFVQSDCLDWNPESSGKLLPINCDTWNCNAKDYFIFWMQNIPNKGNNLTFQGKKLRNWWEFIADFDRAVQNGRDLIF